jgi:hypothetical protein
MEIQRVPLPIGSEAIAICTNRRISELPTARESAAIPICSAIHSPWRCCSPEFPSTPGFAPIWSCFGEDHRKELCALCKRATGSVTENVRNAWKLAQSPGTGPEGKAPAISVAEDKRTGWQLIRSRKKTGTPRLTTCLKNHF